MLSRPTWFMRWGRVLWWGLTVLGLAMLGSVALQQCPAPRPVSPPERLAATGEPCPTWLPVGTPPDCTAEAPAGDLLQGCEARMEDRCRVYLHHACPERAAHACARWRARAEASMP